MNFLSTILPKAKAARKHIVLPEGMDPRVAKAAFLLASQGVCQVTVLATPSEAADACAKVAAGRTTLEEVARVIDLTDRI